MDLVLKYQDKTCTFSDIVLRDFNVPVVNEVELDFQIEPAIWFKSLIIESIVIDCNLRNVFWQSKRQDCSGSNQPTVKSIFDDVRLDECELFNSVINLLKTSEKKPSKTDILSREILRILHVHVFPAIILHKEDHENLREALSVVEEQILQIGEQMMSKDKEILEREIVLHEHRESSFKTENFGDKKYLKKCSEQFLKEILDDTNRDIRVLTDKLITFQSRVDMTGNPVTDDAKMNLLEWRKTRDEVQSTILKLQCIRESVNKNVTHRKKKNKKVVSNLIHETYIELKEKLRCDKCVIEHLFDRKVKTTSVREAIIQACSDLLTSGEATGCEISRSGTIVSTDILPSSNKPTKWLTLTDRIISLLTNTCEISEIYKHFFANTVKKITEFLGERAIFDRKRDDNIPFFIDSTDYTIPPRKEKPMQNGNAYENVRQEENKSDSPHLGFTSMLKEDITQHIYEQCQLLVRLLSTGNCSDKKTQGNQISTNTVWIVYELQLCLHLIEPLSTLYEYIYQEKATEMFSFISSKSLEDLGVQEQWIRGTTVDNTEGNSLACEAKRNKCFKTNIAIVSMKSGSTFTLLKLCENDEDLRCFFNISSNEDTPAPIDLSNTREDISNGILKTEDCVTAGFKPVSRELDTMIRSKSIMGKLRSITRANRMTSECVTQIKAKYCGISDDNAINAEDMLAGTICVLSILDRHMFKQVFAHVNLVNDLIPPFMMGSIQDWSLTNFYCAFQNISCQMESKHT
jgi:Trp operon repressor